MTINSYGKIYNVGHASLMGPQSLLDGEVVVEEKADGSQFSWGIIDGELCARSNGSQLNLDAPEKMFTKAVETIKKLEPLLKHGWVYRSEFLQKPKHNALCYDRVPKDHLIIFDICRGQENYLSYKDKCVEAKVLGLEVVPLLYYGDGAKLDMSKFKELLDRTSVLGGAKIEGVVIKNYSRFSRDGHVLMGKHVSEAFKEVHKKEWKESNPTNKDILMNLIAEYKSKARWQKSILHMEEQGILTHSPKDIGLLIKETQKDIELECVEEIKDKLWNWAKSHVLRGSINGLPEYYKEKLLERQVEEQAEQIKPNVETLEELKGE